MSVQDPPQLLDLADQSLLWNEALAIVVLEELPIELFLPPFMVAFARRHTQGPECGGAVLALSLPLPGDPDEGTPASSGDLPSSTQ